MGNDSEGIVLFAGKKRRLGPKDKLVVRKAKRHTAGVQEPLDARIDEQGNVASKSPGALNIADIESDGCDRGEEEDSDGGLESEGVSEDRTSCDGDPSGPGEGVFLEEDASFLDLGLPEWLTKTCKGLGMVKPTAVQCSCCPQILAGRNVIGVAQTGSGKTAAFALPILQMLSQDVYGVFALLLTPTR